MTRSGCECAEYISCRSFASLGHQKQAPRLTGAAQSLTNRQLPLERSTIHWLITLLGPNVASPEFTTYKETSPESLPPSASALRHEDGAVRSNLSKSRPWLGQQRRADTAPAALSRSPSPSPSPCRPMLEMTIVRIHAEGIRAACWV